MSSILKVDEIQNTTGKTGLVITPDGTVTVPSVKFPEQSNPSGRVITSTTMSSYEEGTWTPASSAFSIDTIRSAVYLKVGHWVTVSTFLENSSGNSNVATITGLPFKCSVNAYGVGSLNIASPNATVYNPHVRVTQNTYQLDLKYNSDSTFVGTAVDGGHIIFTVTYRTDE